MVATTPKLLVTSGDLGTGEAELVVERSRHRAAQRVAVFVEQGEQQDDQPSRDRRGTRRTAARPPSSLIHAAPPTRKSALCAGGLGFSRHKVWSRCRPGSAPRSGRARPTRAGCCGAAAPWHRRSRARSCSRAGSSPIRRPVPHLPGSRCDRRRWRCPGSPRRRRRPLPRRRRGPRRIDRIAERHADRGAKIPDLCEEHPAPAAAEPAVEHRQGHLVDQRRPGELEGIGRTDKGEDADRREIDADLAHPVGQHRERQQQRHAAGEAHQQDDELPAVAIDFGRLGPAAPGRLRGLAEAQIRSLSAVSGRAPTWEMISAAAMPPSRAHSASGLPRVKPNRKPAA